MVPKDEWVDLPHINKRLPGIQARVSRANDLERSVEKARGMTTGIFFLSLLSSLTLKLEIGRLSALHTNRIAHDDVTVLELRNASASRTARRLCGTPQRGWVTNFLLGTLILRQP